MDERVVPSVLVVDDEKVVREGCRRVLEASGFDVLVASEGAEALRILEEHPVGAVLLDLWMPGMHGAEVLEILTRSRPDLPVVVFSGHATLEVEQECAARGARAFIAKPFQTDQLVQVMGNVTGRGGAVRV
jgi:CheY-like chemotaxis protein